MKPLTELLHSFSESAISILDMAIALNAYTEINLSHDNSDLDNFVITDPKECQRYIDRVLEQNAAKVAYGGYLEQRNLYSDKANFSGNSTRNIHLGIDFWSRAGTKVLAPIDGWVHSFQNNDAIGDYGPTIILRHEIENIAFHTLYGHLSLESLNNIFVGKHYKQGDTLATLGTAAINVNYAPHLHFQIIHDMNDKKGDYPGVCAVGDMVFYTKNCPDPELLLKIGSK